MKRIISISVVMAIWFTLSGISCVSREKETITTVPSPITLMEKKEVWEKEWNETLAAVKREGKLVIYLSDATATARDPIIRSMKNNYGIETEIVVARAAELVPRVLNEKKAGIFYPDIFISGVGIGVFTILRPAEVIGDLKSLFILPEVKEGKNWRRGKIPWVDKEERILPFAFINSAGAEINTSFVKKEEMTSYSDLLNPSWRGKILINDPTTPGRGPYQFQAMDKIMGRDFLRQLVKQEPLIMRDQRQMIEWLAHGKYPISIGSIASMIDEFKKAGASLDFIMFKEGSYITSGNSNIILFNNLPHPKAARVFVNWFLGREGQTLWSKVVGGGYISQRVDVPIDHVDPLFVPKPGIKYYDMTSEEVQIEVSNYISLAREMFVPSIR